MIKLEVFGESAMMAAVARMLDESNDVGCVTLTSATQPQHSVVVATVHPRGGGRAFG